MSNNGRRARAKRVLMESLECRQLLTVLTFDPGAAIDGTPINQSCGDRVVSTSQNGFKYGATGGITPNVTVTYGPNAPDVRQWSTAYGDLTNVIYPGLTAGGLLDVNLTADLGFEAQLNAVDLGGKNGRNFTVKSVQVFDGADNLLFSQNNVVISGSSHTRLVFSNLDSRTLRLRIDASNLGADMDKVGLDNLEFAQISGTSAVGDGFADVVLGFKGGPNGPYGGEHSDISAKPVSLGVVLGDDPSTDVNYLSLPTNSYVTVGFVDETVVDGPGPDIAIRELVDNGEKANVYISSDGMNFTLLGLARGGRTTKLDLSTIGFKGVVRAVRVIGLDNGGTSPGFDLINVQAMTGSMKPTDDVSKSFVFASMAANGAVSVSGTSKPDRITLKSTIGMIDVTLNGRTMVFDSGATKSISIQSGAGNDSISIGSGIIGCYVSAGGGDDVISGGDGNDTLTGGAGKNKLFGNGGKDRLNGSGSRDYLDGGIGDDRLYGNGGNDTLLGNAGVDRLFAGDGNDILYGGSSNDKLYGQAGADTLIGQGQSDSYDGGSGTDVAYVDKLDSAWVSVEKIIK